MAHRPRSGSPLSARRRQLRLSVVLGLVLLVVTTSAFIVFYDRVEQGSLQVPWLRHLTSWQGKKQSGAPALSPASQFLAGRVDGLATALSMVSDLLRGRLPLPNFWGGFSLAPVQEPWVGLPKVALMFLTRGPLPLEPVWREFLEDVPDTGTGEGWHALFSLYVHPGTGHFYPPDSFFAGYEICERVDVQWGQFSLVVAERALVRAALQDPDNQWFLMLSEACAPLYPAAMVWAQLLSERLSRINACLPKEGDAWKILQKHRWVDSMATDMLKPEHWRKSSQWVGLVRAHADLVVQDTHVSAQFERDCWIDPMRHQHRRRLTRFCVSDEHYIPTLLAAHGLENETDCQGVLTHAVWDGGYHPKTWYHDQMTPALIKDLRKSSNAFYNDDVRQAWPCRFSESLASIRAVFRDVLGERAVNGSLRVENASPHVKPRPGVYCGAAPPPTPAGEGGPAGPFSPDVQLISETAGGARRLRTTSRGGGSGGVTFLGGAVPGRAGVRDGGGGADSGTTPARRLQAAAKVFRLAPVGEDGKLVPVAPAPSPAGPPPPPSSEWRQQGRFWLPVGVDPHKWATEPRPSPHQALLRAVAMDYRPLGASECSLVARKWDGGDAIHLAEVAAPHLSLRDAADVARRRLLMA